MTIRADKLEAFRQSLMERLAALRELQDSTVESRKPVELDQTSVGRLSRVDAMQRQAMALEVERRRGQERLRLEAALQRLDAGEFGYCIVCGEEIARGRLDVDPTAPTCIRCARGRPEPLRR